VEFPQGQLPPLVPKKKKRAGEPEPRQLPAEEIQKMKELRASDPAKYSQKVLAEMFNVPRSSVAYLAPLAPEVHSEKMTSNFERQMKEESRVGKVNFPTLTRNLIRKRFRDTLLRQGSVPV